MSSPEVLQLVATPITCHAWNKDRTQVALCPNNNEVHIFTLSGGSWNLTQILREHDKLVTSVDWAPNTNRLVTCSQDRNAYVWQFDQATQQFRPTLVLLRIHRAATAVRWSPSETKFAVASGARCISICYFEPDNDWWVSKHLRKPIRSTVLSVAWHPNSVLVAAGAADMRARVFSAFIKGMDERPPATAWGDRLPFNTVCADLANNEGGWVHAVAFSPSGDSVAWVGHDSSLNVYNSRDQKTSVVYTLGLPLLDLLFVSEKSLVAVGHENVPLLFSVNAQGEWQFIDKLDQGPGKKQAASNTSSAFNKFRQMDSRGQQTATAAVEETHHQNTISCIRAYSTGSNGRVEAFSTTGLDGLLIIWRVSDLERSLQDLKIV